MRENELIRKRVKYLSDLKGLSLRGLAKEIDVSYAVLQNTLRGYTPVRVEIREKIFLKIGEDVWAGLGEENGE